VLHAISSNIEKPSLARLSADFFGLTAPSMNLMLGRPRGNLPSPIGRVYIGAHRCIREELDVFGNLSDLDLRLIRVFIAVVDAGGLSAAQGTLNVGQSTLSSQLSTLETRLGYLLCKRGRSGFRLTPKGERFAALARNLLGAVNDFGIQARHLNRKLAGTLRIGLIGHVSVEKNLRIAQAIARFRQRDEAVRFVLFARASGDLESQLLSGQLQLAVGYFAHCVRALQYTPLFVERQLAYCGLGHPLFDRAGRLTPDDLGESEWTWRSYPLPVAQWLPPASLVTAVTDDVDAAAVLVLSGRHLGYLPDHVAEPYVAMGLIAPINPELLHYDVDFHVVTRGQPYIDDVTRAFLDDLLAASTLPEP
jgi:LysR family transcriptional regulator, transcriptional activator for bauABCD operon